MLKTDNDGNTSWSKEYGTDDGLRCGRSVCETYDGGYIVTGWYWANGAWSSTLLIMKTNSLGDSLWCYLTDGNSGGAGYCIQRTSTNDYIVVGCEGYGGGSPAGPNTYLIKIDSQGDTLWSRIYGDGNHGWDYQWRSYSVQQSVDGGFITAGEFCLDPPSPRDLFIIRTDTNGDTLWTRTYGGDSSEIGNSIQKTSDNGYVIVGQTNAFGAGGDDVWLLKFEPDIGVNEQPVIKQIINNNLNPTILSGPLVLPTGKQCEVFDITGRVVVPEKIKPGIYFIEVDGKIAQKVVKVR